jgi:hypothetical protein
MDHAIIKKKRDRRFMYLNTYISIEIFIELFYYISSQVTCIPLAFNPHHTLFVARHYVSGTSAHAVCCHRDWVNGDVYFCNTISPKVTLMSLDYVREMSNYFYVGAV